MANDLIELIGSISGTMREISSSLAEVRGESAATMLTLGHLAAEIALLHPDPQKKISEMATKLSAQIDQAVAEADQLGGDLWLVEKTTLGMNRVITVISAIAEKKVKGSN